MLRAARSATVRAATRTSGTHRSPQGRGDLGAPSHPRPLAAAELLRPACEPHAHHLVRQRTESVANHGRIVLPVDDDDRFHRRAVTSPSIRAVYFSNSSVSTRNWMIFSCPWNGYLRQ